MRLTKWNGKKWILPQGRTPEGESMWRIIADRLAEYEDTGLEPKEIQSFVNFVENNDVVKVVRCKDCALKYMKDMQMFCPKMVAPVNPQGYCQYGERKK